MSESKDIKRKEQESVKRNFGLTTLAVNNRTTVFVLTFIILLLGISSYKNMPKENFPEVSLPTIYIGTVYPGNSPLDIENLITRPIEKEVNTISGVDEIKSTSVQDYSTIIVQFQSNVITKDALQEVKDAVDKIKKDLPTDLDQDPNIFELNFSEFPIMNINLSGDYSIEKLNEYGEYLEDEIEKLSEVSKVEIRGVQSKEVKVNIDMHKMEAMQLSFRDIEGAIANENLTLSGGNLLDNGLRRTVRVVGEFSKPKDIENIIVKSEKQEIVYLGDIAEVVFDYIESESYARAETKQVVMLDVIKRSGGNLLDASDKINEIIKKAQKEVLPEDLTLSITNDQSNMTRSQVANLENSIISGVILVVLVLLFFLGLRNALFVGVAIPLSMFLSFVILSAIGYSINMMVLFGLIMALGMLVDNGIVVVENVYRLMDEGYSALQAAKEGVGEVALPIISSTATTLAAFLPLAFWPGMMGSFMKYLPITLIVVLGSSLFVALVINPVLTTVFMKIETAEDEKTSKKTYAVVFTLIGIGLLSLFGGAISFGNILLCLGLIILLNIYLLSPMAKKFQNGFLPVLENGYEKLLTYALHGKRATRFLFGTIGLLFLSFVLFGIFTPKVLFFPENEPKYVNIFIEFPIGTDIEETNKFTKDIEHKLLNIIEPYNDIVESVIAQVGLGSADPNDPSAAGGGATPNKGRIQVNFVEMQFRGEVLTSKVMEDIRENIGKYPGVSITVDKDQAGPPAGKPVNIEIRGLEYDKLVEISEDVKRLINNSGIQGIENLKSDLQAGNPEMLVELDRAKARRLGLSTGQIAMELRTSLFGKEVSKYKEGEDDYPIMLRLQDEYRYDKSALMSKHIIYRDQTNGQIRKIPVSAVATAHNSSTIGAVKRKDLDRVITLFSNVLDGYNPTEINNQLKELISNNYTAPNGYEILFTGEQEKQAEEMAFLSKALMMAVFLIFLIIVSQFNKISAPAIIIFSVILSTIGVFLGLVIFQMDFIVIMTMIGIISLAGIVVNNAIVLIDYTDLTKQRMLAQMGEGAVLSLDNIRTAIIQSGKTRLRPVLLTAITTVLGLIPLATGFNIDFFKGFAEYDFDIWMGGDSVMFWGPMSWTIVFGITFATFLTLIIVPVMYLLVDRFKIWVGRATA